MDWDVTLFSQGQLKGKWEQIITPQTQRKSFPLHLRGSSAEKWEKGKGEAAFFTCICFHSHCLLSSEEEMCMNTQLAICGVAF